MANSHKFHRRVVVGLRPSQSRLKPSHSTGFLNYCTVMCVSLAPAGGHEASAPPAVRRDLRLPRPRRFAGLREYRHLCHACTHTPSRHLCHSCTRVSRSRCPDRGSCGMMLGSPRCDSVRSRRASVRGSPLTIGTDASQPRPRRSPCTDRFAGRDRGPGRPADLPACLPVAKPVHTRMPAGSEDPAGRPAVRSPPEEPCV